MLIKNPTSSDISVTYQGKSYTVLANGEVVVPAVVATFWKNIHEFLVVSDEKKEETPLLPTTGPVSVDIVSPVILENTVVEEPVKAPKKK